jgi:methyl-accepting chemotaxis protein
MKESRGNGGTGSFPEQKEMSKTMSFIDDMKIGKKLIGGFLIVVLILVAIAALGYVSLQTMANEENNLYQNAMVPLSAVQSADKDMYLIRGNVYKAIIVPSEREASLTGAEDAIADFDKQVTVYKAAELNDKEKAELAKLEAGWATYKAEVTKTNALVRAGDEKGAIASIATGTKLSDARKVITDSVNALVAEANANAKDTDTAFDAQASSTSMTMIVAAIVAVIVAIAIALYLAKSITDPIAMVAKNLTELKKGHLSVRLNLNRKDEIGEMAKTMDTYAAGQQKWVLGTMQKIAEGDLSSKLKAADAQDEVVPALQTTIDSIAALVEEANMLSKAAVAGKLQTRGNADKFKGGYRDIVKGVNDTLDAVVGPVNEAMRVSGEYAQGNFTARVDEKLNVQGDFVRFKQALNNIGIEVSKSMTSINQQVGDLAASAEEANASVEEVSAGSAQVAKNASGVSVNAEKATQGVEQVQKAMEDLSRTIQDVATKSELVAKIVQDTTNFSKEGMELAQKTEQGMQGITKSSNDVNQIIGEIKGQMDKISEIVNLITDLANQTNLLALNAAIEAARAGDAGRGFAVVATEVKSLAVESRASAERISEMIDGLQKQTQNAVDAVTASNAGVREGSEALHETLSSFNKIVTSIDKISQNVSEVAAAAEEQAASVEEVTASVNEVGGLMQATTREATDAAAASQESSAAIDQITKVVANVNTIVDKVTKEISRFKC